MKPEEQRIAIAEACGFTDIRKCPNVDGLRGAKQGTYGYRLKIPDYPADLNAMHEAEKVLTLNQHFNYTGRLERTLNGFCAPADQRAEFLLRTIGKWQD